MSSPAERVALLIILQLSAAFASNAAAPSSSRDAGPCPKGPEGVPPIDILVHVSEGGIFGMKYIEVDPNSSRLRWWEGQPLNNIRFPVFDISPTPSVGTIEVCLQWNKRDLRSKNGCMDITVTPSQQLPIRESLQKLFYPLQNETHAGMSGTYRLVARTACSRSRRQIAAKSAEFKLEVVRKASITYFMDNFTFMVSGRVQDQLIRCCASFVGNSPPLMEIIVNGSTRNESFTSRTGPGEVCCNRPVLVNEITTGTLSSATCVATTDLKWVSDSQYFDKRLNSPSAVRRQARKTSKITLKGAVVLTAECNTTRFDVPASANRSSGETGATPCGMLLVTLLLLSMFARFM